MQCQFKSLQVDSDWLDINLAPLVRLYQEVFSEPPEYQLWDDEELTQIFRAYVEYGYLFVAVDGTNNLIGFSAIVPLTTSKIWGSIALFSQHDTSSEYQLNREFLLDKFGINAESTWYVADLGVALDYRHLGVGCQLMDAALLGRLPAIVRVSLCREGAISLYAKLGFKPMGLFQKNNYKQQDGSIKTFEKMLMVSGFDKPKQ